MAEKYFPGQDPIGQYIDHNTNPSALDKSPNPQIIGIVGHVNQWGLDSDGPDALRAETYVPLAQIPDNEMQRAGVASDVFVRLQASGASNFAALRSRLLEYNAGMVIHNSEDME